MSVIFEIQLKCFGFNEIDLELNFHLQVNLCLELMQVKSLLTLVK